MQSKTKGAGAQAFTTACVLYRLGSMPDLFLKAYRQHSAKSVRRKKTKSCHLDEPCADWSEHLSFYAASLLDSD